MAPSRGGRGATIPGTRPVKRQLNRPIRVCAPDTPTGRDFQITDDDFCRFTADDTIAEQWGILDMIGLLRQLGLVPPARWQ